jgi:CRP/FNR family transcriptional regulator, cyclic AMP receptor protein
MLRDTTSRTQGVSYTIQFAEPDEALLARLFLGAKPPVKLSFEVLGASDTVRNQLGDGPSNKTVLLRHAHPCKGTNLFTCVHVLRVLRERANSSSEHMRRDTIRSVSEPLLNRLPGSRASPIEECSMSKATAKKSRRTSPSDLVFDLRVFLDTAGATRRVQKFRRAEKIYRQGEPAKSVKYIQEGGVRLSVINEAGKEAVVAVLGPGDFFGEGCLAGQSVCMGTATAIVPTSILSIDKSEMMRVLSTEHALSDLFISHILTRNIRIEEDLIDQLFNSSEKRLARALLLLARYGKEDEPRAVLHKVSQETLAEMIGTTRSRVNFFMNKFRKLGFIKYNGGIQINGSLLSVVLHD